MCSIGGELYNNYIQLTDKHTTIFLLNKSKNVTIKLTITYMANLANALFLVTWRWKFHWKNFISTVNPAMKTDVTNIYSECIYSPDYSNNFLAQRWSTFSDFYKLGPLRSMRRLHLLFRTCTLVFNTTSARWQSQTTTPGQILPPTKQIFFVSEFRNTLGCPRNKFAPVRS